MDLPDVFEPVVFVVTRAEVEAHDTSRVRGMLSSLLASPETARSFR